jgi:hypothetical protein
MLGRIVFGAVTNLSHGAASLFAQSVWAATVAVVLASATAVAQPESDPGQFAFGPLFSPISGTLSPYYAAATPRPRATVSRLTRQNESF